MDMSMPYDVPEQKKIRLIINTDTKCEADDQYAIVHAVLTPRFKIKGIIGAHFGTRRETTMEESYAEIRHVLSLMGLQDQFEVYKGAPVKIPDTSTPVPSEGAEIIIREAMKEDEPPLYVIFLGPLTDLASAYLMEPAIAGRLTAIWIGGGAYPEGSREFNLSNDIDATNVVFQSPIPLWQVPKNVYDMVRVSLAELAVRVRPQGEIGKYLYEQLIQHNMDHGHQAHWPKGEMWVLGDSPAVALLLDEHMFEYDNVAAPRIDSQMRYVPGQEGRTIRVYRSIDARFTLEDFYAKLALFALSESDKK